MGLSLRLNFSVQPVSCRTSGKVGNPELRGPCNGAGRSPRLDQRLSIVVCSRHMSESAANVFRRSSVFALLTWILLSLSFGSVNVSAAEDDIVTGFIVDCVDSVTVADDDEQPCRNTEHLIVSIGIVET